jgi:hypothetical protein
MIRPRPALRVFKTRNFKTDFWRSRWALENYRAQISGRLKLRVKPAEQGVSDTEDGVDAITSNCVDPLDPRPFSVQ